MRVIMNINIPISWTKVATTSDFDSKTHKIVRVGKKQIVLFKRQDEFYACNNRCPHEGYPLSEGTLSSECVLTCNWHNWKFDLASGDNLTDGDRLRIYPLELRGDEIWLDVSEAPAAERQQSALANLQDALTRHEYDRMAREIARLGKAGGDPLEAIRQAIHWSHDHFEYGMSHAYAAAADWLTLRDKVATSEAEKLAPVVEVMGHIAWDTLREPRFSYSDGVEDYDGDLLVQAIEDEDEARALAFVRGGLRNGLSYSDLQSDLARAALAHLNDFGHSAIYTVKIGELIEHLGEEVAEPLALALVRGMIFARREDLIPEFRKYAEYLGKWDYQGQEKVSSADFFGKSVNKSMARALKCSADPKALYDALLGALAQQMLAFDLTFQESKNNQVDDNITWLDFTHGITFSNAVRHLCEAQPALWPQGLLQMACFIGRNSSYLGDQECGGDWQVEDPVTFIENSKRGLFDHSQFEYIVACHIVKLTYAVGDEVAAAPDAPWVGDITSALNRFLHSPLKRKHVIRTAQQALDFVARED
jgi:nitrite reductase/ring-hydroxylating ferredoxin subunit